MGVMDREWYREKFARRIIGITGHLDDAMGEPARIRRGVSKPWRQPLPRGAEAGNFWRNLYTIACVLAIALWLWISYR